MLKAIFLLRFRPDLDHDDVRRWWRTSHGALALKNLGMKRYVQNHFTGPIDPDRARGELTYQGVVEVWFEDQDAFDAAIASPEWKALEDDGPNGFLMDGIQGGFVTEHVMRWEGRPDADTTVYPTSTD